MEITVLLIIIGIVIAIWRFIKAFINENKTENIFKKAKSDITYAMAICDSIDIAYKTSTYSSTNFLNLETKLNNSKIGNYTIVKCLNLGSKILLHARCNYVAYDTRWDGNLGDVSKEKYDFFVISKDDTENKCTVYGLMFDDNPDKFRKQDFADKLLARII